MRVLDLDMDFFLSDPCPLAPLGERPDEDCAQVWSDEEIIHFLEERCGLSREHPLPGAIFDTHDKALDFWAARLEDGSLQAPFEVVHVDSRLPQQRATIAAYHDAVELDEANYLLFALAFRWISRLAYVRNPKSHQDIPKQLLDAEGNIHLRSFISAMMESKNGKEPVIPFDVYDDYTQFQQAGYDFVTMAQSPRYAPKSADRIMDIVRRYITVV